MLGLGYIMFSGNGPSRIQRFLLKTLKPATNVKYMEALEQLSNDLKAANLSWRAMTEAEQDGFWAEWVLDSWMVMKLGVAVMSTVGHCLLFRK